MQISKGRGKADEMREREPEMLHNREDMEGRMCKCEDVLFCETEGFVMFLNVPGSFSSTVRNDTSRLQSS